MTKSILEITNRIITKLNISSPIDDISLLKTDPDLIEIFYLLEDTAKEIQLDANLPESKSEKTFSISDVKGYIDENTQRVALNGNLENIIGTVLNLPSDYVDQAPERGSMFFGDTFFIAFNETERVKLNFYGRIGTNQEPLYYINKATKEIEIYPNLVNEENNERFLYQAPTLSYISNGFLIDSHGNRSNEIVSNDQTSVFEYELMVLGTCYKWKQDNNTPYQEDKMMFQKKLSKYLTKASHYKPAFTTAGSRRTDSIVGRRPGVGALERGYY